MKTIEEIRKSFWKDHPELKKYYKKDAHKGDYNTDVRTAFINYITMLNDTKEISYDLLMTATL